jgi:hypothetical protein
MRVAQRAAPGAFDPRELSGDGSYTPWPLIVWSAPFPGPPISTSLVDGKQRIDRHCLLSGA